MPVQAQMVRELGAIIRNQIPSGRASLLDAYGEILLRAWRDCTGASLLAVEDLIQVKGCEQNFSTAQNLHHLAFRTATPNPPR